MTERYSSAAWKERVEPLLDLARAAGDGSVSEQVHDQGRERLLTTLAARRALPSRSRKPLWLMAAVSVAAALVLLLWPSGALEYRVVGATVAEGGYIAPEGQSATVEFSDGSTVLLRSKSRARILALADNGSRLLLEHGNAHVDIVPRADNDWAVQAGPYVVHVTGTAFDVSWEPEEERLVVQMQHGSVQVRGPLAESGVAVRDQQRLVATARQGKLTIGEPPTQTRQDAPTEQPPASESAAAQPRLAAPSTSAKPRPTWSEQMSAGNFDAVLADADARGVDGVLSSAPLGDLVALADAARYRGRAGLSQRALEAQRERFAGSAAAIHAAFLLGRMADDGQGGAGLAIRYYDQYLAEGGGAFSAEALGRKMLALQRGGDTAGATSTAQSYLQHYPKGPHAAAARQIAGAPASP